MNYAEQLHEVSPLSGSTGTTTVTIRQKNIKLRENTGNNTVVFRTNVSGDMVTLAITAIGVGNISMKANLTAKDQYTYAKLNNNNITYFPMLGLMATRGGKPQFVDFDPNSVNDVELSDNANEYISFAFITNRKELFMDLVTSDPETSNSQADETIIQEMYVSVCQNLDLEIGANTAETSKNPLQAINYANWSSPEKLSYITSGVRGWRYVNENDIGAKGYYTVMVYAKVNKAKTISGTLVRYLRVGSSGLGVPGGVVDLHCRIYFANELLGEGGISANTLTISTLEDKPTSVEITSTSEPWTASQVSQ